MKCVCRTACGDVIRHRKGNLDLFSAAADQVSSLKREQDREKGERVSGNYRRRNGRIEAGKVRKGGLKKGHLEEAKKQVGDRKAMKKMLERNRDEKELV